MPMFIEPLRPTHSDALVRILNEDEVLLKSIGCRKRLITREFFETYNREWSERTSSKMFAIVSDEEAIGLISLSHIDRESESACIDYWFASEYWGRGFADKAFGIVLGMAKEEGVRSVSCSVPKRQSNSLSVWKKYGAELSENENFYIPKIKLYAATYA